MGRTIVNCAMAAVLVLYIPHTLSAQQAAGDTILVASDFEQGNDGWKARGTETVAVTADQHHGGNRSLKVSRRAFTWNGALHDLPGPFAAGSTIRVSLWVLYTEGLPTRPVTLSVERSFKDPGAAHAYDNVKTVLANRGEWTRLEADYKVPPDAGLSGIAAYVETPWKPDNQVTADDLHDLYIDDVQIVRPAKVERIAAQDDIPDLRSVLDGSFRIGTAVTVQDLAADDPHRHLILKHFSLLVAANAMKPEALEPVEGTFTWTDADRIVSFAGATGMKMHGHTLLWHQQMPPWFFQDPQEPSRRPTRDLLLSRMRTYIDTVVRHFRGDVASWDVVNEALSDHGGLRADSEGSPWLGIVGPDYIDQAFRFARAADPDALLVINDYNLESDRRKRDEMYALVRGMKARKVPVDAVGMQMHVSVSRPPVQEIREAIEKLGSLGVKVRISELDVSIYSSASEPMMAPGPEVLRAQGERYRQLFALFREEAARGIVESVTLWGPSDDETWLDNFPVPGRNDAPLLFDRKLQAKPAFWGVVNSTPQRPSP